MSESHKIDDKSDRGSLVIGLNGLEWSQSAHQVNGKL